ncbi:MAG: GmrSD restriction endonuclease domain-containing protein, partial [Rhabdochlamydiaceae bacterium]
MDRIREGWPTIKVAIESGVDFINSRGIDDTNLTSANALIPIFYFLYKHPSTRLRDSSIQDTDNARLVRRWLCACLLNNVFGGSSDTILSAIRETLKSNLANSSQFPAAAIFETIRKSGRTATFDGDAADRVLEFSYGGQRTFLALSMLYDEAPWGTMSFHQDHIFPKSLFKLQDLSESGRQDWFSWKDRFGNLCLLSDKENEEKYAKTFKDWVKTRSQDYLERHLIPRDESLYD